jgi:RimJ/RimL family protein N-acetyltransferase
MNIVLARCTVRSWERRDAASMARYADNRNVWLNLRDAFPSPFTVSHGKIFIRAARRASPETRFAIAVDGEAVGSIGFAPHTDVERVSAEIGYWLGESFWGRGITTDALRAVTDYAMQAFDLTRLYAVPFEWNVASCRVLEKCGYALEGRMRRSAVKDGHVIDQWLYAFVPEE